MIRSDSKCFGREVVRVMTVEMVRRGETLDMTRQGELVKVEHDTQSILETTTTKIYKQTRMITYW